MISMKCLANTLKNEFNPSCGGALVKKGWVKNRKPYILENFDFRLYIKCFNVVFSQINDSTAKWRD